MKTKVTKRANGTTRIQYDYSDEKVITDQAPASELTMESIRKRLENGTLQLSGEGAIYSSDPGVRNLQELIERKDYIEGLYNQLPTEIKEKMHNNILNFEKVIFDESNKDLLLKHGLATREVDKHKELISAITALGDKIGSKSETAEKPS